LIVAGLFTSLFFIKDTARHLAKEMSSNSIPLLENVFLDTTFRDRNLSSVTQAGLVNNLNDGMVWGLFPVLLFQKNFTLTQIAVITAVYPAVWGIGQLFTGRMSDFFCKKSMLFWGMLIQGLALLLMIFAVTFFHFIVLSVILGWGTAMVYPTFLATIAENTHPRDRAKSLGIFRFWRDLGYAIGAILTGLLADSFGINTSIIFIGALTVFSAVLIENRMHCRTNAIKLSKWLFIKLKLTRGENKTFNSFSLYENP
jgi:MFS family permease